MKNTLLLFALLLSVNLLAEDAKTSETPDPDKSSWKGYVKFGYVSSTGNTETTNMNGKFHIETNTKNWLQQLNAAAFTSSDNDQKKAERFKLEYQGDRKISDTSYVFINASHEEDKFSGYEYRTTLTGGYGRKLYNENKMTLDSEIGLGVRQSETDIEPVSGISTRESEGLARLAVKYLWQLEENRRLTSNLTIDVGKKTETTISNFVIAFVTMIAGDLSLEVSYTARHTSEVPAGKEKLDTMMTIGLLYAF